MRSASVAGGLPGVGQSHLRKVADGGLRELAAEAVEDRPGAPLGADAQRQAGAGGCRCSCPAAGSVTATAVSLIFIQLALDNFLTIF